VNGFSQHLGIDYFDNFSHVARYDSIQTIFSIAIEHDLDMTQFDAKLFSFMENLMNFFLSTTRV
jgi:hypothetical protein